MSAAENNNHQGSWGSIFPIYGIGVLWLMIRKFSSAGAHDGVESRMSVAH